MRTTGLMRCCAPALFAVGWVYACAPSRPPSPGASRQAVRTEAAGSPTAVREPPPSPPVAEQQPPEPPDRVQFLADGTLVVTSKHFLSARTPRGESKRVELPEGEVNVVASPELAGVILARAERLTFLTTPDLVVAYQGPGTLVSDRPAIHLEKERAVLVQGSSSLLRLDASRVPADARLETVVAVADGKRLSLTFVSDGPNDVEVVTALLFDAQRGTAVGPGLPLRLYPTTAPRAAYTHDLGFTLGKAEVVRWDLLTATAQLRAKVRCAPDLELGNPTPNSTGDLLLVTCGDEGIVLNGKTLKTQRRIPRILPGCDQGPMLAGSVLPDGKTLFLEGCGGVAKLDLRSGKYGCADSPGLLGAPYLDFSPSPGHSLPRLPKGREKVRACSPDGAAQLAPLGHSSRYHVALAERMSVVYDGGKIELEADSQMPVISPDEASIAYARGDRVVVRALPAGGVQAEIRMSGP